MTLEEQWARCAPWLEAALEHAGGTWTIGDLKAAVERGEMVLWAGLQCAFVTHVYDTPRMKIFDVVAAGGDLVEIQKLAEGLILAARELGCGRICASGRRGWVRALKHVGLTDEWVTVAKDL